MLAKLWYRKIVLGSKTFADVPTKLEDAVYALLAENNMMQYL